MLNNIQAVVFDLDNTLVTSSLNFTQIKQKLGCEPQSDLLEFINQLPVNERQVANNYVVSCEVTDAQTATTIEGSHELIAKLNELNINTAIVTRNCKQAAMLKLNNCKLPIDNVLTREEHPAKPAPDALNYLSDLWQIKPQHILYVGDYWYDIKTAQNANTKSCLVTFGTTPEYAGEADKVIQSLKELTEEFSSHYDYI